MISEYERLYGDNKDAMIALFIVLSFYKLEQGDFWADDYAQPDPEKGVIQIARTQWFGSERTDENAAEQLHEVIWRYFPEFNLPRTWSRFAYDLPVGATKFGLGVVGAGTTGLGAVADPEPLTKVGLAGAAVVSFNFAVEGVTQISGEGGAGGMSLIHEAAGWYGQTVGGDEGELSARKTIGVAEFALGLVAGFQGSKVANAKLSVKNFRGTWKDLKKAGIQDYAAVRSDSRKLNDAFQRFKAKFLDKPKAPSTTPNEPNPLEVWEGEGGSLPSGAQNQTRFPDVPGRVQSRINLANKGWKHLVERHFSGKPNASQFSVTQNELRTILESKEVVGTPVTRTLSSTEGIRYVRVINYGRQIGLDKFNNFEPTNIMSVLSDKFGTLVTATPGIIQ